MKNRFTKFTVFLAMLIGLYSIAYHANAQTPPYYNFNTGSGNLNPLNSSSQSKVQWIAVPGQFSSAGGGAGTLAPVGFIDTLWIRAFNPNGNFSSGFEIAMAQNIGTQTVFPSTPSNFITGLTVVRTAGAINFATQTNNTLGDNWIGIPLTTPFAYNPALSLVVQIRQSGIVSGSNCIQQLSGAASGLKRVSGGYTATSGNAWTGLLNMGLSIVCNNTSATITANLCPNQPYVSPSTNYTWTTPGTYLDTITNASGCDSLLTINLTAVYPQTHLVIASGTPDTVCPGDVVNLTASDSVPGGPPICFPTYTTGTTFGDFIDSVGGFGGLLQNQTGAGPAPYYQLFPTLIPVSTGTTYTVTVRNGTYTNQEQAIWIDYNHDLTFQNSELVGQFNTIPANALRTFTINIPNTAYNGPTRMRIMDDFSGPNPMNPCRNASYGETEDYVLNISGGTPQPISAELFCTPTYTSGTTFGDFIDSVGGFGGLIQNQTGPSSAPFYELFPSPIAVTSGTSYSVTVRNGTFASQEQAIWIDYNQNKVFENNELVGQFNTIPSNALRTFNFTIPATAYNGRTLMRVMDDYSGPNPMNPCRNANFGETEDYVLNISGATPPPNPSTYTYSWTPGNILGANQTVNPFNTTNYVVTQTDNFGCTNQDSVLINVNPLPIISALVSPNDTLCLGDSISLSGMGATTYTWTGGVINNNAFVPTVSGTYILTGTDSNGCQNMDTTSITVNSLPNVSVSPSIATACAGSSALLTANGAVSYNWMPGSISGDSLLLPANVVNGVYTVTGTDMNGCSDSAVANITISNPNGDLSLATAGNLLSNPGIQVDSFIHPNDGQTYSYYDASCNLIASVQEAVGGNSLGVVSARVHVESTVPLYQGQPYIARWYDIIPTNQGAANVTLYFTDDDFIDYNANNGSYPDVATNANGDTVTTNLAISKISGGALGVGTAVVINVTALWNSVAARWEMSFPVMGFSQFYLHAQNPGGSALPIVLKSFNVIKQSTTDLVKWTTASEVNNSHFNVQRSANGFDFEVLGNVSSKATNSSIKLDYSFVDQSPQTGHNYYRLEQVDLDGHKSYSKTIDIIWTSNGAVSLYPNPTRDNLNVDFSTNKVSQYEIRLMDMSGRMVKSVVSNAQKGMNHIEISLNELANGMYHVQLLENNRMKYYSKIRKD